MAKLQSEKSFAGGRQPSAPDAGNDSNISWRELITDRNAPALASPNILPRNRPFSFRLRSRHFTLEM
jgi:hypothetical protein